MSIYSHLLGAAIDSEARGDHEPAAEEQLVAELARCRARLPAGEHPLTAGGVPAALADQLAYDLALTALCRHEGVAFDVDEFDRPAAARARLERVLRDSGLPGLPQRREYGLT